MALIPDFPQAIQVGRSVVILELKRENEIKERMRSTKQMT